MVCRVGVWVFPENFSPCISLPRNTLENTLNNSNLNCNFHPPKTCVKYGGIKNGKVINMALATRKAALTRVPRITCYPCAVRHKRLLSSHHQRSFFVTGLTRVAQELVSWANAVSKKPLADFLCRLNFFQNSSSRISLPHNDLQNSLKNSNLVSQFLPFSPCIKVRGTLKTKGGL